MARPARDTNDAINNLVKNINARLSRCEGHANFRSTQWPEARRIRAAVRDVQREASTVWSALQNDPLKEAAVAREAQQKLQGEIATIEQKRVAGPGVAKDLADSQAEVQVKRSELQALTSRLGELDQRGRQQVEENLSAPNADLEQIEDRLGALLDAVSQLERELEVAAKEHLQQVVRTDFESKSKLFEGGENHHMQQATRMLYAMGAAIAISLGLIVWLFFFVKPDAGVTPGATGTVMIVEHALLVGAGRVAIIFLAAWAVKYAADLHRSHAEQSIIYRDRRAALGVAEVLLTATPELEQKRDVLKMLSEGYLNFEQSAFRVRHDRAEPKAGEAELQRIKEVADAVKPLVEVVRPLVEAAKGAADKAK